MARVPLGRAGEGPLARLEALERDRLELQQKLVRILVESGEELAAPKLLHATAGGDARRLRGIPVHARGSMGRRHSGQRPGSSAAASRGVAGLESTPA